VRGGLQRRGASFEASANAEAPQDEARWSFAALRAPHPEVRSEAEPRRTHALHAGILAALLVAALLLGSPSAQAVQPDEILKDPAAESRARKLSSELRCLVCQNESIDDSNAPLAKDLRLLVRERVTAGDTDEQVKAFLVQRYGEFVLLRPPLSARTLALYGAPFAALALGGWLVWRVSRRRAEPVAAAGLTEDERKRLEKLLSGS
jgi:cytochrome c-type biogenesis protein CcmH